MVQYWEKNLQIGFLGQWPPNWRPGLWSSLPSATFAQASDLPKQKSSVVPLLQIPFILFTREKSGTPWQCMQKCPSRGPNLVSRCFFQHFLPRKLNPQSHNSKAFLHPSYCLQHRYWIVCCGCCNKTSKTLWYKQEIFIFSQVWCLWVQGQGAGRQDSLEAPSLAFLTYLHRIFALCLCISGVFFCVQFPLLPYKNTWQVSGPTSKAPFPNHILRLKRLELWHRNFARTQFIL